MRICRLVLEVGNWKPEVGNWKPEVGNWKLEVGNWKLEVGNWKLEPEWATVVISIELYIDCIFEKGICYIHRLCRIEDMTLKLNSQILAQRVKDLEKVLFLCCFFN